MFTGIVTDMGRIARIEPRGDLRARIQTGYDMDSVEMGASIACDGVCLTVVDKGADWFEVDISAETVSKTNLDGWEEGRHVNLERALKVGDELGGHIVSGHIDGVARVIAVEQEGEPLRVGQAPHLRLALEFGEGLGHAVEAEAGEEVEGRMAEHDRRPPQWK